MKNTRFLILLSLIFIMASCQKDQEIETTDLGTEFFISDNGYTSLDTDVTISIDNQKANLSTVKMTALGITDADDGEVVPPVANWDIAISGGAGTVTISSADLGMTDAGWSADFQFDATFDGKAIQRFHSFSVKNPMSLTSPYIWAENDDEEIVETAVTVYQNDDVQYIKWDIAPKRATIESLKIETKVGENGIYVEIPGGYEFDFDSLAIDGNDYNANDTVFYMFTAKNGSHEQVGDLNFVVNTVEFANEGGTALNTTSTQGFDLVSNEIVAASADTSDFQMVHVVMTSIGFVSNNNALFVAADETVYDNNDIVEAKAVFDAGTQESGFANVEIGDVFVYKTMRGTDEHYGIIKITAAYLTTGGGGDYFEFEYRY
jgi:hypothetical protein